MSIFERVSRPETRESRPVGAGRPSICQLGGDDGNDSNITLISQHPLSVFPILWTHFFRPMEVDGGARV